MEMTQPNEGNDRHKIYWLPTSNQASHAPVVFFDSQGTDEFSQSAVIQTSMDFWIISDNFKYPVFQTERERAAFVTVRLINSFRQRPPSLAEHPT